MSKISVALIYLGTGVGLGILFGGLNKGTQAAGIGLVLFHLAYMYRVLAPAASFNLILNHGRATLRRKKEVLGEFRLDDVDHVSEPSPRFCFDKTTLFSTHDEVLATFPFFQESPLGAAFFETILPPNTRFTPEPRKNFDERGYPLLCGLVFVAIGICFYIGGLEILEKQVESFDGSAFCVAMLLGAGGMIILGAMVGSLSIEYGNIYAAESTNSKNNEQKLAKDANPVYRNLIRIGIGLPPDNNQAVYRVQLVAPIPTEAEVNQLLVRHAIANVITFNLILIVSPPLVAFIGYKIAPSWHPLYFLLIPLLVWMNIWIWRTLTRGFKVYRDGMKTLDAVIQLGETPTINGDPIEVLKIEPGSVAFLFGAIEGVIFPHTVTAAGKTYHLNLNNFKPLTEIEPETTGVPLPQAT